MKNTYDTYHTSPTLDKYDTTALHPQTPLSGEGFTSTAIATINSEGASELEQTVLATDPTLADTYDAFLSAVHNFASAPNTTLKDIFREEVADTAQELVVQVLPQDTCRELNIDPRVIEDAGSHHTPTEIDVIILAKATQITAEPSLESALYTTIDYLPEVEMSDKIKRAIKHAKEINQPITEAIISTIDSEIKRTAEPYVYLHIAARAIDNTINYNTLPINDEHLERLVTADELVHAEWSNSRDDNNTVRPIVPNAGKMPVVVFSETAHVDTRQY